MEANVLRLWSLFAKGNKKVSDAGKARRNTVIPEIHG